jgi:glycosyltransferase involved in cell wall biosynthesis
MAIPNWLTPPSALAGATALEARWMRPGRKLFCACGRFNVLKGFRELLEVFAEIKDELPEWDLMLVGDGEDRELLPQMVERLGLRGRVHFPGWVSHPGDFFAASDVFVFPSRSEGFGLVLMEAMACGLPCVAYNCKVGPSEQVGHETDGLLIPDGDRVAFKAAMVRLARDHALRRRFSVEARRAIRRFEAAAVQPMWEDLLCRR